MNLPTYYNRHGEPIELMVWAHLVDDREYATIEQTQVGPYWVSTVWLGIDHNFLGKGPPVIFETMVFAVNRDDPTLETLGPDMDCRRYCTEEAAKAGHDEMVLLIEATLNEEVPTEEHENGDAP
jgi:hypothetical protein